jgi:hypothetical protein
MKPTVQNPDLYLVGNDYVQAPVSAFYKTGSAFSGIGPDGEPYVDDTYRDGIYRVLSDELTQGAWSADPWKDPHGFNKRTILVDPQSPIPTYASGDKGDLYSVADVVYGVGKEDKKDIDPKTQSPVKD